MKIFLTLSILLLSMPAVFADVIRLHNGSIFLGKVINADSSEIVIESFGETHKFSSSAILLSETNLNSLKNQRIDIHLKDGSIIKGLIQNYDEEIGLLVNIDFGSLTLPVKSIKEIRDPVQTKYYKGRSVLLGVSGGCYFPVGGAKNNFTTNGNVTIFSEFNLTVRGLYLGGDLAYFFTKCKSNQKLNYTIFTLRPYMIYRFIQLRTSKSFAKHFVPFMGLGAGVAFVGMVDKQFIAMRKKKNETDLSYFAMMGLDSHITDEIIVRLSVSWQSILQKGNPFDMVMTNIGLIYGF